MPFLKPLPVSGKDCNVSCSLVIRASSEDFRDLVLQTGWGRHQWGSRWQARDQATRRGAAHLETEQKRFSRNLARSARMG